MAIPVASNMQDSFNFFLELETLIYLFILNNFVQLETKLFHPKQMLHVRAIYKGQNHLSNCLEMRNL